MIQIRRRLNELLTGRRFYELRRRRTGLLRPTPNDKPAGLEGLGVGLADVAQDPGQSVSQNFLRPELVERAAGR